MTLAEIKESPSLFLTPSDIASVIGCNPQQIRLMARERPGQLGFPVCCVGNRVRIPKKSFLEFIGED